VQAALGGAGSVSNSVEFQFHHKDTKAQSTQRKWHISIESLGALAFLGILDGIVFVSTEKDKFPQHELLVRCDGLCQNAG